MGRVWSSVGFQLFFGNKVFWQTIPGSWQKIKRHFNEDSADNHDGGNTLKIPFESCKTSTRDTQEVMHLGEGKVVLQCKWQWQIKG